VSERTSIESVLLRDRWLIAAAIALATALCWAWIIPMGRDMYGDMSGTSAWMMTRTWDLPHQVLLFAMWVVMMIGMMLPSAAPALLLYAGVVRKSPEGLRAQAQVYAFAGGYVLVWTIFSLAATVLQLLLARWSLISRMMEARNSTFSGMLLLVAGLYQLTPWKRSCLDSCRSPVGFIVRHWKPGVRGGFHLGLLHGLQCLGCCWALMLLLFVGGVMNLWCIAILTLFVLLEKIAPFGMQGGRLSGVLLGIAGLWFLF
jgi:predicted metal-binding membrane protein